MTAPRAREIRAVYSAGGAGQEIGRTLPLELDEVVITEGMVRLYANPLSQRPCYLRLTAPRLGVLEHYAMRPDRLTEVPPPAVESISHEGKRVIVMWAGPSGDTRTVTLIPWSGRVPAIRRLPEAPEDLAATLASWHHSAR